MAKGAESKSWVENKIRDAFGKDFLGVDLSTKKIYVNGYEDNGEVVQVCISLTCPKNLFNGGQPEGGLDFDNMEAATPTEFVPAKMTEEERNNARKLISKFNL